MRRTSIALVLVLSGCSFINNWGEFRNVDVDGGGRTDAGDRDGAVASDAGDRDAGEGRDAGDRDAGEGTDAGDRDGGFDAGFDGGFDAGFDAGPAICTLAPSYVAPTVVVMADHSGSMTSGFGATTRFNAQYTALMSLLPAYEDRVELGLIIQHGGSPGYPGCEDPPREPPGISNAAPLLALIAADLPPMGQSGGGTTVEIMRSEFPPPAGTGFVLNIMDGAPIQDCHATADPFVFMLDQVSSLTGGGVGFHTINIGGTGSMWTTPQIDALSAIPESTFEDVFTEAELATAIDNFFSSLPCTYFLDQPVDATRGCDLRVLDSSGTSLGCGTDFDLIGEDTFELIGGACVQVLNGVADHPSITVPCDAIL